MARERKWNKNKREKVVVAVASVCVCVCASSQLINCCRDKMNAFCLVGLHFVAHVLIERNDFMAFQTRRWITIARTTATVRFSTTTMSTTRIYRWPTANHCNDILFMIPLFRANYSVRVSPKIQIAKNWNKTAQYRLATVVKEPCSPINNKWAEAKKKKTHSDLTHAWIMAAFTPYAHAQN